MIIKRTDNITTYFLATKVFISFFTMLAFFSGKLLTVLRSPDRTKHMSTVNYIIFFVNTIHLSGSTKLTDNITIFWILLVSQIL